MRLVLPLLTALVLVPAALAVDPHVQTISGVVTANSGASLTVSTTTRSLTCLVSSPKAQVALFHWGTGARATMACRQVGTTLLLARLSRNDAPGGNVKDPKAGGAPATTTTASPGPATTTATTEPPHARVDARGKVTALGGGTITVARTDGTSLTCTVTDGQLHSIQQGAPVGSYVLLVCDASGNHPAVVSLQRLDGTTTTTPAPANAETRQAIGLVTALSSDAVTVTATNGDALRCRITQAPDSAAAAHRLVLGAHVGIVCRADGGSFVLSGATSAG